MRKITGIALNGLLLMVRDPKVLVLSLLMPLLLVAILGTALRGLIDQGQISPGTVLVFNEDVASSSSRSFGQLLVTDVLANDAVKTLFVVTPVTDLRAAQTDLQDGKVTALIQIPPTFTADALAGRPAMLQLYRNPADLTRGEILVQVLQGFTNQIKSQLLSAQLTAETSPTSVGLPPKLTVVPVGKKSVSSFQYYAVAMALMFMIMTAFQRGAKLLDERATGTLLRALTTPTSTGTIVAGNLAGSALVTITQFIALMVGARILFGVDWGPWPNALLLGAAYSLAAAGLGTAAAVLLKQPKAMEIASGAASNLLGLLSGALFPIYKFPGALLLVAKLTPNYWALQGFLDQMAGLGTAHLWPPVAVLLSIALVTGYVGSRYVTS